MSDILASLQPINAQLDNSLLKKTFLEHLNYIYYGKHHLVSFFNEVKDIAALNILKLAILEAIEDSEDQITKMDEMFSSIAESPSQTNTLGIKAMTLEAWLVTIKGGKTPLEKDVFILFYLQQIEGIELTYYKVLKNLARAIGYNHTFLDQSFDIAEDNELLFESIYNEYIN